MTQMPIEYNGTYPTLLEIYDHLEAGLDHIGICLIRLAIANQKD